MHGLIIGFTYTQWCIGKKRSAWATDVGQWLVSWTLWLGEADMGKALRTSPPKEGLPTDNFFGFLCLKCCYCRVIIIEKFALIVHSFSKFSLDIYHFNNPQPQKLRKSTLLYSTTLYQVLHGCLDCKGKIGKVKVLRFLYFLLNLWNLWQKYVPYANPRLKNPKYKCLGPPRLAIPLVMLFFVDNFVHFFAIMVFSAHVWHCRSLLP